jgi:hypothetical protein
MDPPPALLDKLEELPSSFCRLDTMPFKSLATRAEVAMVETALSTASFSSSILATVSFTLCS